MNNYVIFLVFLPGLFLIFMFTKASFVQFLFGFGICLLGQTLFVMCYCILKMQQALLDSTRIKLEQNYELNVEKRYPFKQRKQNPKIFLNKYTQQQKLQTKKNTLKVHSFKKNLSQEEILNEQPKKQMIKFLSQKKHQHNLYNYFSRKLIHFGNQLINLPNSKIGIPLISRKYYFQKFEEERSCEIGQNQLQNFERQVLDELQIKIKIKKDESQNILFPNWTMFIEGLSNVGRQFKKIQAMHESNLQILNMVNGKIIEDFQFIQSQIKKALKSLDQIQKTSQQLKNQNQDFLTGQRNVRQHQMDLMFLLKQHYYKFQDFQLRIKENQKNYHIQTKKLSYFRQKLGSFTSKNKQKYQKIFKTRFFAILDSYNITVEQSIRAMRKIFSLNHLSHQKNPPKVNRLQIFRNIDQQIQAQRKYQSEYFQRARFYNQISKGMVNGMRDLQVFIRKLQTLFSSTLEDSVVTEKRLKGSKQYERNFTMLLIVKFFQTVRRLHTQFMHLQHIHARFVQENQGYLLLSHSRTQSSIAQATSILEQLINPHQPIQHKYRLIKSQLQQKYIEIQSQIKQIKRFQQIYLKHCNRLKKVMIMQFLYFLHFQKLYMNQSDFMKISSMENLTMNELIIGEKRQNNKDQHQDQKQQNVDKPLEVHVDNIYTGQYLTQEYVNVLNRFLFSAYSQWKNSQFFKQTLTKQLYVLLNKQQNENISQIIIENLELKGYPPQILWLRELHSQPFEFLADLSIAFKGKLVIYLKTQYKLMGIAVPTEVKVEVQQFYCVIRLCFVPSEKGQSWFSFIGQPIAKFTVQAKIYTISINAETIRNFFSTLLLKKLKQSTFPIRQKIMIPVSKQDIMLQLIQKRFKFGYNF